jgi:Fe-S cluster assembly protein SufD
MAKTNEQEHFIDAFERRFEASKGAAWLSKLRRSAIEKFAELGFPSTRLEEWRYTNVAPIAGLRFESASRNGATPDPEKLLASAFADPAQSRVVFIDGRYSALHSRLTELPPGVRVQSLWEILGQNGDLISPWLGRYAAYQDQSFVALNTAFMEDGAVILIPEGCHLEDPIQVIFAATGGKRPLALHPRNLIVCGQQSEAKIVETYVGLDSNVYFNNPVSEISAAPGSILEHYRVQREGAGAFHVGTLAARLERDSNLASYQITLGGALVRNDLQVVLGGEGCECTLNGLYLTEDDQHIDNHTEIDHARPRCASRELYKGILRGRARGVFNGKIIVRDGAQKTDARQTNKNLLLSDNAVVNSKPQLEIHADDVKCSHGSTIGQLDRDALFYLRARGIGAEEARRLLSYGFAADILNRIRMPSLRARLEDYLLTQFGRTAGA